MVTPVSRLDDGRSPLVAAASAVRVRTGLGPLRYVAYLGEQPDDTSVQHGRVAWFLFIASDDGRSSRVGQAVSSLRWAAWDDVVDADDKRTPHLRRAHDLIAWRRAAALPYSAALSDLVERCGREASQLLSGHDGAGLGLCGSAARGDFIDGWSDVDLIGWGIRPSSPVAQRLDDLAAELEHQHGIRTSLDLADPNGEDAIDGDPLYTAKLQGILLRGTAEMPVLAGCPPPVPSKLRLADRLDQSIDRLHRFAVRHLASDVTSPTSSQQGAEGSRRVLAVACHAARDVATVLDPEAPRELGSVASLLAERWPGNQLTRLLDDYRGFRQSGAPDDSLAGTLAARVPGVLRDLQHLVASAGMADRQDG